jgi:predicted DNA-binding transcriptional regulator YafY
MGPNERRQEIMETLCHRRQETMNNLAFEFGVSVRTIRNDIDILSLSYPLETVRGRYGGGVRVMDGFYMNRKYLKPEQRDLLMRLSQNLFGKDLALMNGILQEFALNQ